MRKWGEYPNDANTLKRVSKTLRERHMSDLDFALVRGSEVRELRAEVQRLRAALAYAINTDGGVKPDDYEYIQSIAAAERSVPPRHQCHCTEPCGPNGECAYAKKASDLPTCSEEGCTYLADPHERYCRDHK